MRSNPYFENPHQLILTIIIVALAGAMLMPALIGAVRIAVRVLGVIFRAGLAEAVSLARSEIFKWLLILLAALFGLGVTYRGGGAGALDAEGGRDRAPALCVYLTFRNGH